MRKTTTPRLELAQRRGITLRRSLAAAVVWVGAALLAGGCSDGYDAPASDQMLLGDLDCQNDYEPSQGDPCSKDCLTATCASGTGRRICTCEGGVFLQCACLPPESWPFDDVPAAPYCDDITGRPIYLAGETCTVEGQQCRSRNFPEEGCTCSEKMWLCGNSEGIAEGAAACESFGSGRFAVLKDLPCFDEWRLCISRDQNPTGTSPRGCFCGPEGNALIWTCGPTNRWFRAE